MKFLQTLSQAAVVSSLLLFVSPAFAGDEAQMCPSPLMVCENATGTDDGCPRGYVCTCVPSCPRCRDCATRVCVQAAEPQCRTACDCEPGLGCFDNRCIAGFAAVYCCDGDVCPPGNQCQHKNGDMDRCPRAEPECRTACDCDPGLGCFDNQCIAGFAPVFCCDSDQCPAGQQCQHKDGRNDHCPRPEPECRSACDCKAGDGCHDGRCVATDVPVYCCESDECRSGFACQHRDGRPGQCQAECTDQAWLCRTAGDAAACGDDRVCTCSAACPSCENCGPSVCVPPNLGINPYACNDDGSCSRRGDRCTCVSSCPECDDCALNLCLPSCNTSDRHCTDRLEKSRKAIRMVSDRSRRCFRDADCVHVDTSTECEGTCGTFVNRMRRSFVARANRYLDHKICSAYQDDGCPYATPGCLQLEPACVEGLCTGRPPERPETSAASR